MSTKYTVHTISSVFCDMGTRFSVVILMNFRLQNVCLADEQVRWDNLSECSCIWKDRVSNSDEMGCQCTGKKQNLLTYFLGPNILLSTLFSNTLSLRSSLSVSNQVSHPYKTTGKIIILYILILKFLDSKRKDKRFCTEC